MAVRVGTWVSLFLIAYLAASFADLWTTRLALGQPGVSEGNVFATNASGGYLDSQAWVITAVGGAVLAGCVAFAAVYADRVSAHWVRHPIRSFRKFYLFPWSPAIMDRSPLHLLSLAAGFVVLRLLAAVNNLLLSVGMVGPIGAAVRAVGERTSPAIGLGIVTGVLLIGLAVALSPVAAVLFRHPRPVTEASAVGRGTAPDPAER